MVSLFIVNMIYQLIFLIIIVSNAEMNLSCDPGEVTQPYTFTYTFSNNSRPLLWTKNGDNIFTCSVSQCTLLAEPGIYEATRSGLITTLTIKAVTTQSGGNYSCDGDRFICIFRVFAKPNTITCQDPEFQTETNEVAVFGTVLGVYPHPVCQFSWYIDNKESLILQKSLVEYNNLSLCGETSYCNQSCSFKVPARNFTRGKHQFQLLAYPDVTGQDSDTIYGKNSTQTSPKIVADPIVSLECWETTVQEGKQFSCTCKETANKFILPTTTLFYGAAQLNSTLQQVTANVVAKRNASDIVCQAQLPDGTKANKTQAVQVYYGPSNMLLRVIYKQTANGVINFCGMSLTVTVACNATDVSPGVNYQFYSNLTNTPSALPNMSAVNYTVTSGGLFYVLCTGNNSLNSSLSASTNTTIQVTAPPSPPVIEKYQDGGASVIVAGDQLTVQEGVTRITCRVEGGYPSVSGLLLECGSQTSTTKDNNVLHTDVSITRRMDGSNCSCTATHNSTCYRNNKAQSVLDVHYGPSIFIVEANNNSGKVILEKNSSVSISCQAEGNPSPNLSLKKDGKDIQPVSDSTHKSNRTLTYNKVMTDCLDTGVYMCHAETGQAATNKTVAVYVKCVQQFRDPDNLSQSYKEQLNGTVSINVTVFGYPEPTVTLSSNKYILSSETYTLNYTQQEPPYGTVSLLISIKNASYFQNYSLNINNTVGALTYSFEIVEGDPVTPGFEKSGSPEEDVGAIVGGIVAAILVIIIIFVIVYLVRRKGGPCGRKKDQNPNNSMHSINGSDKSVEVDNSALYYMGEKSEEVVIDNSDLYNMNNTVTVDNSDLYNLNQTSQEVEVDNSDLYNMNRPVPGDLARNSEYKKYSDVTPTITSATSVPLNMRNKQREDISNPYEDVSSGNKNKPKPPAAPKPKPVAKPKPQAGKQEGQKAKNTAPDQTYATVVKLSNSDKPFAIKEEHDDFFLDPSQQPEVPEKNFENPYEDAQNEKITEKKLSDKKKNKADKSTGKASEQHKDPSSLAFENQGFSSPDDDLNVYANT